MLYQFNHKQIAGLTQHYSTNALYLTVGIIIATFNIKLDFKNHKNKSILESIFYVLLVLSLLLTGKRTQVLFLILIMAFIYLLKQRNNLKEGIKKVAKALLVFAAAIILLSFFIPSIANSFIRIFHTIGNVGEFNTRIPLYKLAIDKFIEKPIFGWGWGSYRYVYNAVMVVKEREYLFAHCIYLQSLMEVGIIGSLVLYSCYIFLLIKSIKNVLSEKSEKLLNYGYLFLAFHLFFMLEGLFGNSLYEIIIIIPYCPILALFMYSYYKSKEKVNKLKEVTQ